MFGEEGIYSAIFMVSTLLLFTLCDTCLYTFTETTKGNGNESLDERSGDEVAVKVDDEKFEQVDNIKDNRNTRIWIVCVFLGMVFSLALVFTQYLITMVLSW